MKKCSNGAGQTSKNREGFILLKNVAVKSREIRIIKSSMGYSACYPTRFGSKPSTGACVCTPTLLNLYNKCSVTPPQEGAGTGNGKQ